VCIAIELSLVLWGGLAFEVRHGDSFYEAVPIQVPAQIVPAMLLLYGSSSAHQALERQAGRRIAALQLSAVTLGGVVVAAAALVPAYAHPNAGTLNPLAGVSAFVGMYGIGLAASVLIDRRLAGIPSLVPVLAPLTFDPTRIPGHSWWSFVIPGDESRSLNPASLGWLIVGILLATIFVTRAPLLRRND